MRTLSPLPSQQPQPVRSAFRLAGLATALLFVCSPTLSSGLGQDDKPPAIPDVWQLVWSDEFDFPDGARIDPSKWTAEVGGEGWGNRERQYYTDRRENATIESGCLVIRAIKENLEGSRCWYGPCEYTSSPLPLRPSFTIPMAGLKRGFRSLPDKGFGLLSGCWAATSSKFTGQPAAKSIS